MGKLFLPAETRGIWDAKDKSLTVYVGEDAFVGYQGTVGEMDDLQFSASGPNLGECATETFNEGVGRRSTRIDTSKPGKLTLEVTSSDKNVVAPITIYIRMRPNYAQMSPEGQLDETACWAASLAWWLRVLPDRPSIDQQTLLNKLGVGLWNKSDGTMNPAALETLVAKNGYRMRCQRVTPNQLVDFMGYFPLILGFTASGGFSHMNVLCGYDAVHGTVDTMEPMYPDPIFNDSYQESDNGLGMSMYTNKADGTAFVYDGAVRTGLTFDTFKSSPVQGGYFWVGYPAEYAAKM